MKYIKSLTVILLLLYSLTGCSYVSDYVEGQITNRASFSVQAEYDGTNVVLIRDETDYSDDFAGIEIYRSSNPNNEYALYEMIAYKWNNIQLRDGSNYPTNPKTFTDDLSDLDLDPISPNYAGGVYFYRVSFIHWDDSLKDREEAGSGYSGTNPVYDSDTYDNKTSIGKVS
jgi:hypothetical protein